MNPAWRAELPLIADSDVCVVGSGSAGCDSRDRGRARRRIGRPRRAARLAADGAILELALEPAA